MDLFYDTFCHNFNEHCANMSLYPRIPLRMSCNELPTKDLKVEPLQVPFDSLFAALSGPNASDILL